MKIQHFINIVRSSNPKTNRELGELFYEYKAQHEGDYSADEMALLFEYLDLVDELKQYRQPRQESIIKKKRLYN